MNREQREILGNYATSLRIALRELESPVGGTTRALERLSRVESLARNAREKIGYLEVQLTFDLETTASS